MRNFKTVGLFLLYGAVVLLCTGNASAGMFGRSQAQEASAGDNEFQGRTYIVHKPSQVGAGQKLPLILVLHGGMGNAEGIQSSLQLDKLADQQGFIVAYLNGTGGFRKVAENRRTWNAGNCCGIASKLRVDDVSFIDGVIQNMEMTDNIDPSRVYLVGHSNGAMMSYRFVCERPDVVKAMVSIAGSLTADRCKNTGRNLQVLEIHGTDDRNVPPGGGVGENSITKVEYRSVDETGAEMSRAGASFNTMMVNGGEHSIKDLNQALRRNYSTSLADVIVQFIEDNAGAGRRRSW